MKDINFIQAVPEHQKRELRRWILISSVLMISITVAIAFFTYIQLKVHYALLQEKELLQAQLIQFDVIMEQQHKQKEEKKLIQTKLATLNACAQCTNPFDLICALRKALHTTGLQSLKLNLAKNTFELQALCNNAKQATKLVETLSQTSAFKNSTLISLQSVKNNMMIGTIKADLQT